MPAYSIAKQKRQPSFVLKNTNPGIGQYNTQGWRRQSRKKNASSISMTKAAKFMNTIDSALQNVGPGSYNPQKLYTNLKSTIKGRNIQKYKTQAPSPAEQQYSLNRYNPKIKYNTKQYSFGNSRRKLVTKQGPSPNAYTLPSQLNKTATTFCKQQRTKLIKQRMPGPGQYKSVSNLKNTGEYSFTHEKKFLTQQLEQKQKQLKPGPGAYHIGQHRKNVKGGKFLQTTRQCIKIQKNKPGPGQYNSSTFTCRKQPRPVIGTQQRNSSYEKQVPGPGTYDSVKPEVFRKYHGQAVFTLASRDKQNSFEVPGPGSYQLERKKHSIGASIGSRHNTQKNEMSPGPQKYNPQYKQILSKNGQTKFGKQSRQKRIKTQTPGPGAYNYNQLKFSKTYFFSKAQKTDKKSQTIGPGQYKLKPYLGQVDGLKRQQKDILYV